MIYLKIKLFERIEYQVSCEYLLSRVREFPKILSLIITRGNELRTVLTMCTTFIS